MNRMVSISALFFFSFLSYQAEASPVCQESIVADMHKVGDTRLRVYFFNVYDAALYTPSGAYPDDAWVLSIEYLRTIKSEDLVDTTKDEWEELGFPIDEQATAWLDYLRGIWPDVSKGDCLTAYAASDETTVFYNHEGKLGEIDDALFTERFFAIWLSEKSSYRRNRDQLTGASP